MNSSDKPGSEVFIIESSPAVRQALGAHRPSKDSTYVLCRSDGEHVGEFSRRVLRRTRQIRQHSGIASLWYVIGAEASEPSGSVPLLEELLPLLESGSQLTLASPRSRGHLVFGWMDALLGRCRGDVNMGVRFYPDASGLRRGALDAPRDRLQCA